MRDELNDTSQIHPEEIIETIISDAQKLAGVVARLEQTRTLYELTDESTVRTQTLRNFDELDALISAARANLGTAAASSASADATSRETPTQHVSAGTGEPLADDSPLTEVVSGDPDTVSPTSGTRPTPAAMVGTAPPKTPRPPRNLATMTMSTGAEQMVVSHQIPTLDLELVVTDPTATWLGENPHSPDKPTVAVRDDHEWGLIYYMIGQQEKHPHVISVKPTEVLYRERRELTAGFRKSGAGSSDDGQKRPVIDSLDAFVKRAEAAGLHYAPGRKHGKISKPGTALTVTIPTTPSDARAWSNAASTVKRVLDVDI